MQAAEQPIQNNKAGRHPDDPGPALVGCLSDFDCPASHFSQWPKVRACIAVLGQLIELGFGALSFPNRAGSYRVLAAALGQMGRTAEAKEVLEKAIAIAPAWF